MLNFYHYLIYLITSATNPAQIFLLKVMVKMFRFELPPNIFSLEINPYAGLQHLSHSVDRAAAHNVIHATPGPSWFENWQCGSVVDSFMLFLRQPLMDTICKWTSAGGELIYNRK